MNDHLKFQIACAFLHGRYCEFEKTYNGKTDSTQVIIWKKDGKEYVRSVGGTLTYAPEFKQLLIDKINELF